MQSTSVLVPGFPAQVSGANLSLLLLWGTPLFTSRAALITSDPAGLTALLLCCQLPIWNFTFYCSSHSHMFRLHALLLCTSCAHTTTGKLHQETALILWWSSQVHQALDMLIIQHWPLGQCLVFIEIATLLSYQESPRLTSPRHPCHRIEMSQAKGLCLIASPKRHSFSAFWRL